MKFPQKLYKYQPFSHYSLQNLKNNCLYFNNPNDFNDPYDTTQEVLVKNLDASAAKDLYFGTHHERSMFETLEKHEAKVDVVQKIVEILSNSFPTFVHSLTNALRCKADELTAVITKAELIGNLTEISDQVVSAFYASINMTIKTSLEIIRREKVSSKGVCCFSEDVDNLLMWSYYADGHKGFCLEFDTSFDPFTKLHKVNYTEDAPVVDANKIFSDSHDHTGIVEAYLSTKFLHWSHEKEWRIFHQNSKQEFNYKSNALTGLYFGAKMPLTHVEILMLIIKGQHKYCKFYQMRKLPGSFSLIPQSLLYTSFQEAKDLIFPLIKTKLEAGIRDSNELIRDVKIDLPVDESQLRNIIQAIIDDYEHKS